uniref:Matrilin 2 n=1 Tax=Phasianus colchicus TaxID=9054 RepID=A0A669P7V8_PHACC
MRSPRSFFSSVRAQLSQPVFIGEVTCNNKRLDLVFIIDSSRSVRPYDFEKVKEFILTILQFLDISPDATRVGLIQYGSTVKHEFSLKTFRRKQEIERAVRRMMHLATGTMTGLAIQYAVNIAFSESEGARPLNQNVPRVIMIVTDGRPQDPVAEIAAKARNSGILIFAIGVGRVDMNTLKSIGSEPHEEHIFLVANFSQIETLTSVFQTKLCGKLCGQAEHRCDHFCINTPGSYVCRCKQGYILNADQKTCSTQDLYYCAVDNQGCQHECVNTEDSYYCRCHPGFILNPDKRTCRNICSSVDHGCEHVCVNTDESYVCRCYEGFALRQDGKTYGKTCRRCTEGPVDLVFVIDGSKSLGEDNFEIVKQFVSGILDTLEISPKAARVGLLQYSSEVRTEFTLRQFSTTKDMKKAVSQMKYMGRGSMTGLALKQMFERSFTETEGARPLSANIPRISIVFTDGRAQDEVSDWAARAKRSGIIIYAIGIGKAIEEELLEIASEPSYKHLFYAEDFTAMEDISEELKVQICEGNSAGFLFLYFLNTFIKCTLLCLEELIASSPFLLLRLSQQSTEPHPARAV